MSSPVNLEKLLKRIKIDNNVNPFSGTQNDNVPNESIFEEQQANNFFLKMQPNEQDKKLDSMITSILDETNEKINLYSNPQTTTVENQNPSQNNDTTVNVSESEKEYWKKITSDYLPSINTEDMTAQDIAKLSVIGFYLDNYKNLSQDDIDYLKSEGSIDKAYNWVKENIFSSLGVSRKEVDEMYQKELDKTAALILASDISDEEKSSALQDISRQKLAKELTESENIFASYDVLENYFKNSQDASSASLEVINEYLKDKNCEMFIDNDGNKCILMSVSEDSELYKQFQASTVIILSDGSAFIPKNEGPSESFSAEEMELDGTIYEQISLDEEILDTNALNLAQMVSSNPAMLSKDMAIEEEYEYITGQKTDKDTALAESLFEEFISKLNEDDIEPNEKIEAIFDYLGEEEAVKFINENILKNSEEGYNTHLNEYGSEFIFKYEKNEQGTYQINSYMIQYNGAEPEEILCSEDCLNEDGNVFYMDALNKMFNNIEVDKSQIDISKVSDSASWEDVFKTYTGQEYSFESQAKLGNMVDERQNFDTNLAQARNLEQMLSQAVTPQDALNLFIAKYSVVNADGSYNITSENLQNAIDEFNKLYGDTEGNYASESTSIQVNLDENNEFIFTYSEDGSKTYFKFEKTEHGYEAQYFDDNGTDSGILAAKMSNGAVYAFLKMQHKIPENGLLQKECYKEFVEENLLSYQNLNPAYNKDSMLSEEEFSVALFNELGLTSEELNSIIKYADNGEIDYKSTVQAYLDEYKESYINAYGVNELEDSILSYQEDMDTYAQKLTSALQIATIAGSFACPCLAGLTKINSLITAGQIFSKAAFWVGYADNAINMINTATSNLSQEEKAAQLQQEALNTAYETAYKLYGKGIAKCFNTAHQLVSGNIYQAANASENALVKAIFGNPHVANSIGLVAEIGLDVGAAYAEAFVLSQDNPDTFMPVLLDILSSMTEEITGTTTFLDNHGNSYTVGKNSSGKVELTLSKPTEDDKFEITKYEIDESSTLANIKPLSTETVKFDTSFDSEYFRVCEVTTANGTTKAIQIGENRIPISGEITDNGKGIISFTSQDGKEYTIDANTGIKTVTDTTTKETKVLNSANEVISGANKTGVFSTKQNSAYSNEGNITTTVMTAKKVMRLGFDEKAVYEGKELALTGEIIKETINGQERIYAVYSTPDRKNSIIADKNNAFEWYDAFAKYSIKDFNEAERSIYKQLRSNGNSMLDSVEFAEFFKYHPENAAKFLQLDVETQQKFIDLKDKYYFTNYEMLEELVNLPQDKFEHFESLYTTKEFGHIMPKTALEIAKLEPDEFKLFEENVKLGFIPRMACNAASSKINIAEALKEIGITVEDLKKINNKELFLTGAVKNITPEKFEVINKILFGERLDGSLAQKASELSEKYGVNILLDNDTITDSYAKNKGWLGIKQIPDNYMEYVEAALIKMQEMGQPLPKQIYFTELLSGGVDENGKDMKTAGVFSSNSPDVICVSLAASSSLEYMQEIIYHENTHRLDSLYAENGFPTLSSQNRNPINKLTNPNFAVKFDDGTKITLDDIAKIISSYATANDLEFFAEVNALVIKGTIVNTQDGYKINPEFINEEGCYINAKGDFVKVDSEVNDKLNKIMLMYEKMGGKKISPTLDNKVSPLDTAKTVQNSELLGKGQTTTSTMTPEKVMELGFDEKIIHEGKELRLTGQIATDVINGQEKIYAVYATKDGSEGYYIDKNKTIQCDENNTTIYEDLQDAEKTYRYMYEYMRSGGYPLKDAVLIADIFGGKPEFAAEFLRLDTKAQQKLIDINDKYYVRNYETIKDIASLSQSELERFDSILKTTIDFDTYKTNGFNVQEALEITKMSDEQYETFKKIVFEENYKGEFQVSSKDEAIKIAQLDPAQFRDFRENIKLGFDTKVAYNAASSKINISIELQSMGLTVEDLKKLHANKFSVANIVGLTPQKFETINKILFGERLDTALAQKASELGKKYNTTILIDNDTMTNSCAKSKGIAGAKQIPDDYMEYVEAAFKKMQQMGQPIPEQICFTELLTEALDENGKSTGKAGGIFCRTNNNTITVSITSNSGLEYMQEVIYHENTHRLDYLAGNNCSMSRMRAVLIDKQTNPNFSCEFKDGTKITLDDIGTIISSYATKNNAEFFAEVNQLVTKGTIIKTQDGYKINPEFINKDGLYENAKGELVKVDTELTDKLNRIMHLYEKMGGKKISPTLNGVKITNPRYKNLSLAMELTTAKKNNALVTIACVAGGSATALLGVITKAMIEYFANDYQDPETQKMLQEQYNVSAQEMAGIVESVEIFNKLNENGIDISTISYIEGSTRFIDKNGVDYIFVNGDYNNLSDYDIIKIKDRLATLKDESGRSPQTVEISPDGKITYIFEDETRVNESL